MCVLLQVERVRCSEEGGGEARRRAPTVTGSHRLRARLSLWPGAREGERPRRAGRNNKRSGDYRPWHWRNGDYNPFAWTAAMPFYSRSLGSRAALHATNFYCHWEGDLFLNMLIPHLRSLLGLFAHFFYYFLHIAKYT